MPAPFAVPDRPEFVIPHVELPEGFVTLSSDHHFGHRLVQEERGFPTIQEMNETLVARHNALVKPTDVFIALGDLCMGDFADSLSYAARLNGIKFLVPGNHDRVSEAGRFKPDYREKFRARYEEAGFTMLPELGVTVTIGGVRFALSHYPYTGDHTDRDRHTFFRPQDNGLHLLHGHIHGKRRIDGRMFNVGVDVNDFAPVTQTAILEWALAA
ncbi:metallophosphoesterase [Microbacterium sp. 77mftsu3.1]|uniref:metallophosphoesterase n=1 Tax=Microbacterium sp. 77mftsu3.1 TaxID=1761802 RepID=UPI0003617258|nr:metallophosphoesterase [Microbacterium sp. 77mftsu3.1]SDH51275.1 Calcineurin-like phosphoesterase superfamily protein [Microbacterium sp. 77mftsu3.1]